MIKDIIDANNNVTVGAKEIEILKEHFPACFRNGSFDIERLKEYLKDKIHVTEEGYELRFLGKNYARLLASLDTTTVIVPDAEHNNLPENKDSKNIYISGDNLDALKHLFCHSMRGKSNVSILILLTIQGPMILFTRIHSILRLKNWHRN